MTWHTTQSIGSTGVGRVTRIGALAVDAGKVCRTVGAGATSENTSYSLANLLAVTVLISSA
jgi:hypothetical protein